MKRLALLASITGCFGEGPEPTAPTQARVLFRAPSAVTTGGCAPQNYLGDVAIGADQGYAAVLPYVPSCDGGGGTQISERPVPIFAFSLATGATNRIGEAGATSGQNFVRIATTADGPAWAFAPPSGNGNPTQQAVFIKRNDTLVHTLTYAAGVLEPAGLVADGTGFFVGGWSVPNSGEPNNPQYPCCGQNTGQPQQFAAWSPASETPWSETIALACETTNQCFVGNSTHVFYLSATNGTEIASTDKGLTDTVVHATVESSLRVTGLAVTDQEVVWAVGPAVDAFPLPDPSCTIFSKNLATQQERQLVTTTDYLCQDVAIDATHVYFTIVRIPDSESIQPYGMRGLGLGRVKLDASETETIRHGIVGASAGPRRVYLAGDEVIAVDPFTIAAIAKSAFAGMHDFP